MSTHLLKSMTAKLELAQQPSSRTPAWIATASLFASLIPLSLAPILVKLCEREIGSNAVAFHRGWIARCHRLWLVEHS
jgi:hypothetical protein